MKYIYFLILSFLFLQQTAQTPLTAMKEKTLTAEVDPPAVVKENFKKEFPEVTPVWKMDGVNFRAEFVDAVSLKGRSVTYDPNGKVLRRESEMDNASYPQAINDYFIKKYPGEKFKTWTTTDAQGEKAYYIRREAGLVWFDKDGQPVEASGKSAKKPQ